MPKSYSLQYPYVVSGFRSFFRPHFTIPNVPWKAKSRWDINLKSTLILFFGLAVFGLGDSLLVQSHIGNAPWTVLAQGLAHVFHTTIGIMTAIISVAVLLAWIPLKEKPGFGTLANIALIATFIQIGINVFPEMNNFWSGVGFVVCGILMVGIGSALYISTGLGPGPRDGAMTGIHYKTGVRIGRVRLAIESSVLTLGALCGGEIGPGTALFALFIGQSIAISLGILARLTAPA